MDWILLSWHGLSISPGFFLVLQSHGLVARATDGPLPTAGRAGGVNVEPRVLRRLFNLVIAHATLQQRPHALQDLLDRKHLALHPFLALCCSQNSGTRDP